MSIALPFSIFSYSSSLEFFQDAYEFRHAADPSFSYEAIADACSFKSRTLARSLIKGSKNATVEHLRELARCFGLNDDETGYLLCLHRFQEASTSQAGYELFQKLIQMQKQKLPTAAPFREIEIATSVLHMTLLSLLDLEGGAQDPEQLTRALKNRYGSEAIRDAIRDLESHRYVVMDESSGRWRLCQRHLKKIDFKSTTSCADSTRSASMSRAMPWTTSRRPSAISWAPAFRSTKKCFRASSRSSTRFSRTSCSLKELQAVPTPSSRSTRS